MSPTTPRDYHRCVPLLDEFPSTHRTLLEQALEQGDIAFARRHVMARAYGPLCLYARASSLRSIAPAEDLVGGFFASRFGRDDYLARWLAHPRGMPLRRWLVNGLILAAREAVAARRRDRVIPRTIEVPPSVEAAPWTAFERQWRNQLLELACDRVAEQLDGEGRRDAWTLFVQHVVHGVPYARLEDMTGIHAREAPMVTRTVLRRLRRELAAMLGDEFDDPREIARELGAILADGE